MTEYDELMEARRAVALLLDHAVHDCEKNDKTMDAVYFAGKVLHKRPNEKTIEAIMENAQ